MTSGLLGLDPYLVKGMSLLEDQSRQILLKVLVNGLVGTAKLLTANVRGLYLAGYPKVERWIPFSAFATAGWSSSLLIRWQQHTTQCGYFLASKAAAYDQAGTYEGS
jgi:hypothetical protein